MRKMHCCSVVLSLIFLAGSIQPVLLAETPADTSVQPAAADVEKRMADLEKELAALQGELAALKAKPEVTPVAAQATATTPAAAPTPAANPLSGLASVLGGATVTGLVDGYYTYNTNQPANHGFSPDLLFNPRSNQFGLNLIELGLVKTPDKDSRLGYDVTFGFGEAMNVVNASGADSVNQSLAVNTGGHGFGFAQNLKEGYLSYLAPVGKGLQLNVGKFVTPAGAEVIESNANWNYSRSLLFYYAVPFYHYGANAKYAFNDKIAVTGYVVNGWNDVVHDVSTGYSNSGKTGGVSLAWTPNKKWAITETWLGGPGAVQTDGDSWRNLTDTVITYTPNAKLSLMVNGDYGRVNKPIGFAQSVDWYGGAGYIKYQFNPKVAFATRYEYYGDPDGYTTSASELPQFAFAGGQHLQEVTATLERKFATHLISRLEYRYDMSNKNFFPLGGTHAATNNQNTVSAGMIFVLEPNQ